MSKALKNERKYIRQAVERRFDLWLDATRRLPLGRRIRIVMSIVFTFLTIPEVKVRKK